LKEALADNIKLLSSWDKYKKEVLSGGLDWTPLHTSEQFWLENAAKFEERDFQVCGDALPKPCFLLSAASSRLLMGTEISWACACMADSTGAAEAAGGQP
jgi:hypothetical protein